MSEAQLDSDQEQMTSAEDKFFGVKTQIGKKTESLTDDDAQYELEIIDDRPEEDRRPPKTAESSEDIDDEELSGYSERFRRESISFATNSTKSAGSVKLLRRCAKKLYDLLNSLVARIKKTRLSSIEVRLHLFLRLSTRAALQEARNSYKKAYEEGDTDNVVGAQERLMQHRQVVEAERYENNLASQQAQREQYEQQGYQQQIAEQAVQNVQQQAPPPVAPEAQNWAAKNSWFMQDGYEEMTAWRMEPMPH